MADSFSIVTGIVGLLTGTGQVTGSLLTITNKLRSTLDERSEHIQLDVKSFLQIPNSRLVEL